MANVGFDQAEGLRRVMAVPQTRIISMLSASNDLVQYQTLTHLAGVLQAYGERVLLINARSRSEMKDAFKRFGVQNAPTLLSVVQGKHRLIEATVISDQGYRYANLMSPRQLNSEIPDDLLQKLNLLIEGLAERFDVILVNAELTDSHMLPLYILNQAEIIIQLDSSSNAIKEAYKLIKRQYGTLGKRSLDVLVTESTFQDADKVYKNLSTTAKRYLNLNLNFLGAIPRDLKMQEATQIGRSILDAFPQSEAAGAFRALLRRFVGEQSIQHTP